MESYSCEGASNGWLAGSYLLISRGGRWRTGIFWVGFVQHPLKAIQAGWCKIVSRNGSRNNAFFLHSIFLMPLCLWIPHNMFANFSFIWYTWKQQAADLIYSRSIKFISVPQSENQVWLEPAKRMYPDQSQSALQAVVAAALAAGVFVFLAPSALAVDPLKTCACLLKECRYDASSSARAQFPFRLK